MKAVWNGATVAESDATVVVGNHYSRQLGREDLCARRPSERSGMEGQASYYSLEVDGQVNDDAAWFYPTPAPAAQISGRVAWKGVEVTD